MSYMKYYFKLIIMKTLMKLAETSNIEHRTSNKSRHLKFSFSLLWFFLCFLFLSITAYSQASQGSSCSNPNSIILESHYQGIQIDMTSLNAYYLLFSTSDPDFYLDVFSAYENHYPSQINLYENDCYGTLVESALLNTDSLYNKSLELSALELAPNYYLVEILQNNENSATEIYLTYKSFNIDDEFPYNDDPNGGTAPKGCDDIMYNGSFEIKEIPAGVPKNNINLNQLVHYSHGYLKIFDHNPSQLNSGLNRGDYFSPIGNLNFSPPSTLLGNGIYALNHPNKDSTYAGLFTVFGGLENRPTTGEFREWICGQMWGGMVAGQRYYVSMKVRLSNKALYSSPSVPPGILFTDTIMNTRHVTQAHLLSLDADIQDNNIITDTTIWHTVSGFYDAQGGEHFVTIANFLPNSLSGYGPAGNSDWRSYFFIDHIQVLPAGCCTSFEIEDNWHVSHLLSSSEFSPYINGITLENIDLKVNGTFIVNQDLTLKNVNLFMEPHAKIIVNQNATLTIDNSKLKVCGDTMWEGIEIIKTGSNNPEVIMINNSEIWDAQKGILSTNGGKFTVRDSYFNSNNYGIYVDTYTVGKHPGTVEGTTFEAMHDLLYHVQNRTDTTAEAGIYLNDVANLNLTGEIEIGGINGNHNYFNGNPDYHNLHSYSKSRILYGIFSKHSSFKVVNSIFENFNNEIYAGMVSAINVEGIETKSDFPGGYIPVAEIGSNSLNSNQINRFNQTTSAVIVKGIQDLKMEKNDILYVSTAIPNPPYTVGFAISVLGDFSSTASSKYIIQNNNIDGVLGGILFFKMDDVGHVYVANNNLSLRDNGSFSSGIEFIQVYLSTSNIYSPNFSFEISNNSIFNSNIGINIQEGHAPNIAMNSIGIQDNSFISIPVVGISVSNVSNLLPGAFNPVIELNNIYNMNSGYLGIDIGIAANIIGWNYPIMCNDIQNFSTALYFGNVINFSPQFYALKNNMENNFDCFVIDNGTELGNVGDPNLPSDNIFDWSNLNYHTHSAYSNGNLTNLYVRPGGLPYEPVNNWVSGYQPPAALINIIPTTPLEEYHCSATRAKKQKFLTNKLRVNQDIMPSFDLKSYSSDTALWMAKYMYYRALENDSIINREIENFIYTIDASALGQLLAIEKQILKGNKVKLTDVNNIKTIIPQEVLLKRVIEQQLVLKLNSLDTLPSSVRSILEPIAKACPYIEGPAVYKARAMMLRYAGEMYFNSCEKRSISKMKPQNKMKSFEMDEAAETESNRIEVYPNPTKEDLTVNLIGQKSEVKFKVFDVKGSLVLETTLNQANNKIDLKELPSGIYLYHIINDKGEYLKTDKLIVQ